KHLMFNDPDPHVRQESVTGLAPFPSKKNIHDLIKFLVNEKNKMVALRGEAVLLAIPAQRLIKAFKRVLKTKDEEIKNRVLLLYSSFQKKSDVYLYYLIRELKKAKNDKARLPIIESLGLLENQKALTVLNENLHASPLIAYASMSSIVRIWKFSRDFPIIDYLESKSLVDINKQIALKHFIKISKESDYTKQVIETLTKFLRHTNLNLRYLAVQALSILKDKSILEPFMMSIFSKLDDSTQEILKKTVVNIISDDTASLTSLLEEYKHNPTAMNEILSMVEKSTRIRAKFLSLWPQLTDSPLDLLNSPYSGSLMRIVLSLIMEQKITLSQLLHTLQSDEKKIKLLSLFSRQIKNHPTLKTEIPPHIITKWLDDAPPESSKDMIGLLGHSNSEKAIPLLVSIALDRRYEHVHAAAVNSLGNLVGGAV
ncbi:MAG: hypothetical protein HQM16_15780, partial [Deltaproteobacteria bacterium]|nr:hypothetical protein [Deltaproteobacteria bacterium]